MIKYMCSAFPNLTISGKPEINFKNGVYYTEDKEEIKRIDKASSTILITKEEVTKAEPIPEYDDGSRKIPVKRVTKNGKDK